MTTIALERKQPSHVTVATASLIENFIDEAEKRVWFLYEASRSGEPAG